LADNSRGNYALKKELFTSLAERITLVPVSGWLGEFVRESFLADCGVRVIRNGIDISAFAPMAGGDLVARNGLSGRKIILGVASPWSARKGLSDFVKLRERLPLDKYAIVLIGLEEAQLATLPEGIVGLRRTNSVTELAEWYSAADVFWNPTYEDNYPTTNLEAIACGTPVVTYRTGGSPESVTTQTGVVIEQGDVDGACAAIESICDRGKECYAQECRRYAEAHFDKDRCFEQYIELYRELLNNTR
jgi:glycosyltransferase involved in cell wall biosynthesis